MNSGKHGVANKNILAIKKSIDNQNPFAIKFFMIDTYIENILEIAVTMILDKLKRTDLAPLINDCVRKLIINALRMNIRTVLASTSNSDNSDLQKIIPSKRSIDNIYNYQVVPFLRKKDLWIMLEFSFNNKRLKLVIENNLQLTDDEEVKIRKNLEEAMSHKEISEFYLEQDKNLENAAEEMLPIIMFLRGTNVDPHLFRIGKTTKGNMFYRIEFPLNDDFVNMRNLQKLEIEKQDSTSELEKIRIELAKKNEMIQSYEKVLDLTKHEVVDKEKLLNAYKFIEKMSTNELLEKESQIETFEALQELSRQERIRQDVKEKQIRDIFGSYINPKMVNIIIKNPDMLSLGGVEKEITILFSDIRNFTELAESINSTKLIKFLNGYFSEMTNILMRNNGTLDKYIGDALMAFWGAPVDFEDHALKACRSSLMFMEALHQLNKQNSLEGIKAINIGIGLSTGNVIVGNTGSNKRKNYTVIGTSVNLASRLESLNKIYKTNIIISEYTYEFVKDEVVVRELDLVTVKGSSKPVKIYELLEVKGMDGEE